MRRTLLILALCLPALVAVALPVAAEGKSKKKAKTSAISKVSPMRTKPGRRLTIRGKGFSASRKRNTVIFTNPRGRVAFAKPRRASHRKLVVVVPGATERLITRVGGAPKPTRMRLRVVVKRRYGKLSRRRNSPLVLSRERSGGFAGCGRGSDPDRDLLSTSTEDRIGTDPCGADTDGDGVEDGFEQQSALDLNQRALPYPGKRPFANALDSSDAGDDYDGDGLTLREEYGAWAHARVTAPGSRLQAYTSSARAPAFGGPFGTGTAFGGHAMPMSYSDGKQTTTGVLTDDARDADGDGLSNFEELRGLMAQFHYPAGDTCGYEYKPLLPRRFASTSYLDWDSDGDGIWDGNDDQDTDGVSNRDEVDPPYGVCDEALVPVDGARDGAPAKRHPYNPCLPDPASATCRRYAPRG